MPQFTTEERIFVVHAFHESHRNYNLVIQQFRERFPQTRPLNREAIRQIVTKFQTYGVILNRNAHNSGRLRSGRSAENIELVQRMVENNPRVSCLQNASGLPRSTFWRILRYDLNWRPYTIHVRHQLTDNDFLRRERYCRWFLQQSQNPLFLNNVIIGDESQFAMNGEVNTHNVRQYSPRGEPPSFNYDRPNSRQKVLVWAGFSGNGTIFGPYFFDVNVNGEKYRRMIKDRLILDLMREFEYVFNYPDVVFPNLWWFQDGAPPHRERHVMELLRSVFPNKIVSLNQEIEWPSRSPDLTPLDLFLWGYLKGKVYTMPPPDIASLQRRIEFEFDSLRENPAMVRRAMADMAKRATRCLLRNGRHVEGVVEPLD